MKISVVQVNLSNNTPKSSILVDKNVEVSRGRYEKGIKEVS